MIIVWMYSLINIIPLALECTPLCLFTTDSLCFNKILYVHLIKYLSKCLKTPAGA